MIHCPFSRIEKEQETYRLSRFLRITTSAVPPRIAAAITIAAMAQTGIGEPL